MQGNLIIIIRFWSYTERKTTLCTMEGDLLASAGEERPEWQLFFVVQQAMYLVYE